MKVLVLTPITKDNWLKEGKNQKNNIIDFYSKYQKASNIPYNIEIEFVQGQNLACTNDLYSNPTYYYDRTVLSDLEYAIYNQDVLGIIVDPILTLNDLENSVHYDVEGELAQEIYYQFSTRVPIYWLMQSNCHGFIDSELFKNSVDVFYNNGHVGFPVIHDLKYDLDISYQNMMDYFFDCYFTRKSETKKTLIKKAKKFD